MTNLDSSRIQRLCALLDAPELEAFVEFLENALEGRFVEALELPTLPDPMRPPKEDTIRLFGPRREARPAPRGRPHPLRHLVVSGAWQAGSRARRLGIR